MPRVYFANNFALSYSDKQTIYFLTNGGFCPYRLLPAVCFMRLSWAAKLDSKKKSDFL